MAKELDDDTIKALKSIIDHFDDEDSSVRDRQVRQWRKLKLMWENIQHTFYSEVAHDWRIPESERGGYDSDQGYYDKPINLFRAYLESIIAALSVTVPSVTCYPDDADNPLDVTTAKAGDKIAALIFKHNNVPLLWVRALFVYCTEGMTAMYTYTKESEEYGLYDNKKYEEVQEDHNITTCPFCQAEMSDELSAVTSTNPNEPIPPDMVPEPPIEEPIVIDEFDPSGPYLEHEECESCGRQVIPEKSQQSFVVTKLVGITKHPKSRVMMEVYGGLFVKVPLWARNQAECNYLIYSYETHYTNALEMYPDLRDRITQGSGNNDKYEKWGRTSTQYLGEQPENNVTIRQAWIRPAAYNLLEEDEVDKYKKDYPNGMKIVIIDDFIVECVNESLDDHWTLTYNPLSDYVHFDPIGLLLTSIQEITNDLVSLTLQTVEHGIPQTFADPKVLNFNSYRNSEVIPGGIYPATPKSGKSLSDGFYEVKTATLSQEVLPFAQKIQEMGQMASGALPSLFGGQMSGSRTASEYSMSKNQALQRLQTTWKMLTFWWKDIFGKVIPMYIKEVKEDEKQVKRDEFGKFINVFIRKAELEGKIGSIELEANENLPITWNQQKDSIMELIKSGNEMLMSTLMTPENLPYLKKAIGLTDYVIPGEDDRHKQYEEIQQLVNSEPIQMPPDPMMMQQSMMMGQPPPPPMEVPSVEADVDVDDHAMEADICRRWLISEEGRLCKLENPMGYKNVLLHMKMHKDMMQQKMMEEMMAQMPPPPAEGAPKDAKKQPQSNAGVPLNEGQNAPTIQ